METYRPIQTQPQGLLGFLQLKNVGKNPSEMSSLLQMTLDLRQWMLETAQETITGTPAAAPAGTTVYLTVPDGEWWCIHNVTASLVLTAGGTIIAVPAYRPGAAGAAAFAVPMAMPSAVALDSAVLGLLMPIPANIGLPMFLGPGGQLCIRTLNLNQPTGNCTIVARITRLKA